METPPPYIAPKAKNNRTLIVVLIVMAVLLCCGGPILLFGGAAWLGLKAGKPFFECIIAMGSSAKATQKYVEKTGKYPDAAKWQDQIAPYFGVDIDKEDREAFQKVGIQTPDIKKPLVCWNQDPKTGIAFNSALSGRKASEVKAEMKAVLFFETETVKLNNAEPYKPKDKATAPKILNQAREWLTIDAEGDVRDSNGQKMNVNVKLGGKSVGTGTTGAPEAPKPADPKADSPKPGTDPKSGA